MTLAGLAARNVLRNKFRVMLTILGTAVAVLTFVTLRSVVFAWTNAEAYSVKDRVVTRHKVTFVMTLPRRYVEDVRGAKGPSGEPVVRAATFANWFGGKDPKHDREFFGTLAIDSASYFDVYDEVLVPKEQREAFMKDRSGCIVGDQLAKKLGWKVGDTVTLESGIYPAAPDTPWTFNVSGIYTATAKSVDRLTFLFHYERLNDAVAGPAHDQIGWIISRSTDASHAADAGLKLDKVFDDRDVQTLSQDERSFNASFLGMISAVLKAIDIVSAVILVIMTLILGNTIAMGVRERTNEYGVLKAIGFRPSHIAGFVVGEAALVALAGGVLGLLISYPIAEKGLGGFLETQMPQFFPSFRIPTMTSVLAVVLALVLGTGASLLPALRASRLRVTEALRRIA
jgi:putative ABC transport system permease protein